MAFPPSGYPAVDGVTPVVAADFNDVVAALQAHIGATVSFHGVSHVVTESNLEGLAQAIVGAMFAAGSHSGVSVSYNAGAGSICFACPSLNCFSVPQSSPLLPLIEKLLQGGLS